MPSDDGIIEDTINSIGGDEVGLFPWSDATSAKAWVLTIMLGALFSLWEAVISGFLAAGAAARNGLESAGSNVLEAGGSIGGKVLVVVEMPFELLESAAAGAGPLAPIVVVVSWALAAAFVGAVVYAIWRMMPP